MSMKKQKVIVIVGPTSSGKSDLAVDIATKINMDANKIGVNGAEIISADSRQVYKGFNLSSGKITKKEMKEIPHHMLNVASPKRTFTVVQFKKRAERIIKKLHEENKIPIICGGTGFWIDALIYDFSIPEINPNLKLRKKLSKLDTKELYKILKKIDKKRSEKIDIHNKRRLIRAIEITKELGYVPKLKKHNKYNTLTIGIMLDKNLLHKKIYERLVYRIQKGMIREIKHIHDSGISFNRLKKFGLEFKWISKYLNNEITKEKMIDGLYKDTKKYSKKQMIWFKRNKDILWIKKTKHNAELLHHVLKFLSK